MASFTLDDIRTAAEAKYASTDIAITDDFVCRLVNPLRLPKTKRDELVALQERMDKDSEGDQVEMIRSALRLVASDEHAANVLIDHIGEDLAVLAQVFATYGESTQVGEASASAA